MKASEALRLAAEDANLRRVDLPPHARLRMRERGAQTEDVRSAMMTATKAKYDPELDRWKLTGGRDLDGDDLTVVVSLVPTCVVTVF